MYRDVGLTAGYDTADVGNYQHRQTVLITYGSVNWATATGSKPRHIYVIRRGTLWDTRSRSTGTVLPVLESQLIRILTSERSHLSSDGTLHNKLSNDIASE